MFHLQQVLYDSCKAICILILIEIKFSDNFIRLYKIRAEKGVRRNKGLEGLKSRKNQA